MLNLNTEGDLKTVNLNCKILKKKKKVNSRAISEPKFKLNLEACPLLKSRLLKSEESFRWLDRRKPNVFGKLRGFSKEVEALGR